MCSIPQLRKKESVTDPELTTDDREISTLKSASFLWSEVGVALEVEYAS